MYKLDPFAKRILAFPLVASSNPFRREIAFEKLVATLQVPGMFSFSSAKGPIKAITPCFLRGNKLFLFFNNTKLCVATLREKLTLASVKISVFERFSSQ